MRFKVVIPARFASQRLPGKPLALIQGKPLILHVCERARESGAEQVVVATDDGRIQDVCREAGVDVQLTSADHPSGTDRIAEVSQQSGWDADEIVVNLQGDEPLMPSSAIRQVAELLNDQSDSQLATLCTPVISVDELLDPNVVKVVVDRSSRALYFSRAPIPWNRDGAGQDLSSQRQWHGAFRHIGLYAYRVLTLNRLTQLPACELEQLEKLEQLRALWNGMKIAVAVAQQVPGPSVDTRDDLERVTALMAQRL